MGAINGQSARQRVTDFQANDELPAAGGGHQRVGRERNAHQLSVRAGFVQVSVMGLRLPAETAARVRRVMRELLPSDVESMHANPSGARAWLLARPGIAV